MRILTTSLLGALAIAIIGLSATSVDAGCRKRHVIRHHYGVYNHYPYLHKKIVVHEPIIKKVIVEKPIYIPTPVVAKPAPAHCFNPHNCHCMVLPGDTWYTIAERQYGNAGLWPFIAKFNGMGAGQQLSVGQQIQLPRINQDGTLLQSTAPAPASLPNQLNQLPSAMPNQLPAGSPAASGGFPGINFSDFNQLPGQAAAGNAAQSPGPVAQTGASQ